MKYWKGREPSLCSPKMIEHFSSANFVFVRFLIDMKLGKYIAIAGFSVFTRNAIIVYHVVHLASGHTLLCRSIKSNTLFRCLSEAANLSRPTQIINLSFHSMGHKSKFITNLFHESKQWETMSNYRKAVTKDTVGYLIDKGCC